MTLTAGATVGRYTILEPLGQGGMATVYKAFQPSLEREVALKVLRPGFAQDKEFLERFEREAKAIARLRHPHIVQVFDFEMTEGQYVLAMEFLEGGTLKDRQTELARAHRGMDPQESVRIVAEVAEALTYAHEQGIVHRDVKPSNVMLTRKDWAVVTDFGIARILGATSHTQTGVGIGTPEYMAPEQGQGGRVDHRADIYSLGAMAYEMLTGQVPYTADTPLAVVIAHIKDPLPLPSKVNPTIGPAVERVLLRALAKDPEQRFASATDMAQALREGLAADAAGGTMPTMVVRAAGGTTAAASAGATAAASKQTGTPTQVTFSVPPLLRQRPVALALAGVVLVAAIGGTALVSGALRSAPELATHVGAGRPPLTGIPKGPLVYEAKFSSDSPNFRLDARPPYGTAQVIGEKIELSAGNAATVGVTFPVALETYVAEIDLARVSTNVGGASLKFVLREAGSEQILVELDPSSGAMDFLFIGAGKREVLAPHVVTGVMQATFPKTLTAVVESDRYTVFFDGTQVAQFTDDRLTAPTTPRLSFSSGRSGVMTVHSVRFYELTLQ